MHLFLISGKSGCSSKENEQDRVGIRLFSQWNMLCREQTKIQLVISRNSASAPWGLTRLISPDLSAEILWKY